MSLTPTSRPFNQIPTTYRSVEDDDSSPDKSEIIPSKLHAAKKKLLAIQAMTNPEPEEFKINVLEKHSRQT